MSREPHNDGLDEILADYMRRVDRGEPADHDALIEAHPLLATELREYFSQVKAINRAVEAVDSPNADTKTFFHQPSDTQRGQLEVRCPGCHAPMQVAVDTALTDLTCSSCGSHFSLVNQNKSTWVAPSLTRLGRFDLIGRLGIGGFGVVWKARDKELDRTVAIKIPRAGAMTAEEQEKFFREARAAAQLRHPNIVSVHEVGRDGENVYIVSDFVRGVTLGDWLTGQQLTSREAAELCGKIADALHHAHEHGVVHRDLKPANIMMDGKGQPHLMDFGLARREMGEVTVTIDGQIMGTPAYMSPEQAQGESHTADRRSDIYSMGVILFQLLTGELPFRGNLRMLLQQVIHDEPPAPRKFNANVPKDLETVTLKCLEKEPGRRYQTADEFAAELRRFLKGEPVQSRPISKIERSWRWCRRRPASAGLVAAGVASLIAFAAWGLREIQNAREWQLQLSDNLVKSAELHGRGGEWKEALAQLDQANALGSRDPIALQVQRLKALAAFASPQYDEEIGRLASRKDLGRHEADVRLLQGLDLLVREGMDSAAPYFQQAKASGTLSPSDIALVDGLTVPTSEEALNAFRKSVELAPFGQEARRFLVLMLASCGRFDEAIKHGEVGQEYFPEDPNFPVLLAYVASVAGNTDEVSQRLQAKSLRQIDPNVVKMYGEALQKLTVLREQGAQLWDFTMLASLRNKAIVNDPKMQAEVFSEAFVDLSSVTDQKPEELIQQLELVRSMTSPSRGPAKKTSIAESAQRAMKCGPNCLIVAYAPIRDLFSLRTLGYLQEGKGSVERIDQLIDRLQASSRAHPDSFFAYARGMLLFVRGRLPEAADAFTTASEQYSAFFGLNGPATFAAARCEFALHRQGAEGALERALKHMRKRLDQGPLRPQHAAALFQIAMAGKDYQSARRLLAAGDPTKQSTPQVLIAKAKVELAAENYPEALRLIQEVPESAAEHAVAADIQKQCVEKLSKVINDHQPAPPSGK